MGYIQFTSKILHYFIRYARWMEKTIKIRATLVTVMSWILIVLGGISLVTSALILNDRTANELITSSTLPATLSIP